MFYVVTRQQNCYEKTWDSHLGGGDPVAICVRYSVLEPN